MVSRRAVIIGCGNVGTTVSYNLYLQNVCDVVLLNHNSQKAISNAYDINDDIVSPSHVRVSYGSYFDIDENDIIINCAGSSAMLKSRNRASELENSIRIASDIIEKLSRITFHGIFINVMNPCDEVTWMFKDLDLPKTHILGTGTMLETFRLRRLLYEQFGMPCRSFVVGNHGTTNKIVVKDEILMRQNEVFMKELLEKVQNRVWDIYAGKGCTNFGIANVVEKLVSDILMDLCSEECVCTFCADETYGIMDRCISVPSVISSDGIKNVIYYADVNATLQDLY